MIISTRDRFSFRSVFISDIHLGTRSCQAEKLLQLLRAIRTEKLYLVGDILDIESLSSTFYWRQSHNDVIRTILGMAKHGTRVTYIPGNHDVLFREYCGLNFGKVTIRRTCTYKTVKGKRYLVTHGDDHDARMTTSIWLAKLGTFSYRSIMTWNTRINWLRARLGHSHWSLSGYVKRKSASARRFMQRFEIGIARAARQKGFDGVICGHIHQPADKLIDGVHYLNDGDWVENCSIIAERLDGTMLLLNWSACLELISNKKIEPSLAA